MGLLSLAIWTPIAFSILLLALGLRVGLAERKGHRHLHGAGVDAGDDRARGADIDRCD